MPTEQPSYHDEARTALLRSTRLAAACLRVPLALALSGHGGDQIAAQAGPPAAHGLPDPAPALALARRILAAGAPLPDADPPGSAWATAGALARDAAGQPTLALSVQAPAPRHWDEADQAALEAIAAGAAAELRLIGERRRAEERAAIAEGRAGSGLDWLLSQREPLYRLVLRQLPAVALLVFDHDMRYLFAEGAPLRRHGFDPHQIEGRTIGEVLGPAGAAQVIAGYRAALAGETHLQELTSDERIFAISFAPLRDAGGAVLAGTAVVEDITAYRQIEAALDESQTLLQQIVDNAETAVYALDPEGHFILANQTYARLVGAERVDQLIGRPAGELAAPDLRAGFAAELRRILETGEALQSENLGLPADQSQAWLAVKFPIADPGGAVRAVGVIATDIAAQKQAEQVLRANEARYRAFVAATPDLLFRVSRAGLLLDLETSAPENLIAAPDAIIGRQLGELLPPEVARQAHAAVAAACESGAMQQFEYDLETRSGRGHFEARVVRAGEDVALVIVRDISAQKQSEAALRHAYEQLQQANQELARSAQLKDAFLASMSHELRTPLNTILGFTTVLSEQIYGPLNEQQGQALSSIEESGHQLLSLINDILELSSIEAGSLELDLSVALIDEICQASVLLIQQQAQRKHIGVVYTIADPGLRVMVDPLRVSQILLNLLSNAVKFTPEGGRVGLDVGLSPDGRLILTVWDEGIGILAEDLPRLFQPFVQLDSRLSRRYGGTGLGLAIVQRLARLHGGAVRVESTPGAGSRFSVELPVERP